jgi:hypothetical protein
VLHAPPVSSSLVLYLILLNEYYEGRLQISRTHLITPSRNLV